MKLICIDDCDWYIGESLEACRKHAIDLTGNDTCEAYELFDLDLKKIIFTDIDEDPVVTRSFKEQLNIEIAKGGEFPRFFATSEV